MRGYDYKGHTGTVNPAFGVGQWAPTGQEGLEVDGPRYTVTN